MERTAGRRRARRLLVVALGAALVAAACTSAPRPGDRASVDAGEEGSGDELSAGAQDESAGPTAADADGDGVADDASAPGAAPSTGGAADPGATTGGGQPGGGPGTGGGGGGGGRGFTSTLFKGADDTRGITSKEIVLCAHAALTYGAAFNTSKEDLNVYWTSVNDAGGVFGRKVRVEYENDNYSPDTAVQAATACKDKYDPFMVLGGIGFDQIPAVRVWAQNNRMLYFHHTATVNGADDKTYSFTPLPSTEKMGEMFAELAATKFPGKKVGIVKRGSENWEPGVDAFKRLAKKFGIKIVLEREVQVNKGNYLQDIIDLDNSGADVVWIWLNALETTEFIKQAAAQQFRPQFMVFPFNLMSQTLDDDALNPPLAGVAMYNAYSKGDYKGEFAKYADDMKQFEAQYKKYRPNVDVGGVGGDLLFLNWTAQKGFHQLLLQCGENCTRNRLVELVHGYKGATNSSACEIDFTRADSAGGHRGGFRVSTMEAYKAPSGDVNFRNTKTCVEHLR